MIVTKYSKEKDYIKVVGHAGSDVYGKDLICAGVSVVTTGLANAIGELGIYDVGLSIGFFEFDIKEFDVDEERKDILKNYINLALIQLRTIEEAFPTYIRTVMIRGD